MDGGAGAGPPPAPGGHRRTGDAAACPAGEGYIGPQKVRRTGAITDGRQGRDGPAACALILSLLFQESGENDHRLSAGGAALRVQGGGTGAADESHCVSVAILIQDG